jgi:AraC-like DNA-binding protein
LPSSAVNTFTDPDDYASAIRAARGELTVIASGRFAAKLIRIDLHDLWMQRFTETLPRIGAWANVAGRAIISFRTRPGPSLLTGSVEMQPSSLMRHREAERFFQQSSGEAWFGSLSLPVEKMVSVEAAIGAVDLTPPHDSLLITPPPAAMARLQHLHAGAAQLAEAAPAVLAHPEAARGIEQALIEAMMDCLGGGEVREDRAALRQHAAIMRRFHRTIEQHLDQPLYIPDLCAEIGASERTLRACCQEHLGMSPKRYLLLRRMHLVRRALRESTPADSTVTETATRYGFWQFGRLAGEYRALFGEAPSETLARQ